MSTRFGVVVALALSGLLPGCTVGPAFTRPAAPPVAAWVTSTSPPLAASSSPVPTAARSNEAVAADLPQRFDVGADVPALWWQLLHCAALDDLVRRALANSHDVAAGQAALAAATEQVLSQQGLFWPQLDASLSSTRQLVSNTLSSPLADNTYSFNLHTAQLNVSYVPDVFGRNRRLVESLQAQAEVQAYQLQATRLTLVANVVLAVVQQASLKSQIDATTELLRLQGLQRTLIDRQVQVGQLATADLAGQDALIAQTEAMLPLLQKQQAQQRTLLAALLGRFPDDDIGAEIPLAALDLPAVLPLSLPSRLVDQRPDVRAAEAQWHAASAQVGVAIADRLPQITLGVQGGSSAAVFPQLFAKGNNFMTMSATLSQQVFDGGALLHRQRAAEATYRQAEALYQGVVVTAFQNVADALHAIDIDARALTSANRFEQAASAAATAAQRRFDAGDANVVDLIVAQQALQQARLAIIQSTAGRLADTAALLQALGGGWWSEAGLSPGAGDSDDRVSRSPHR